MYRLDALRRGTGGELERTEHVVAVGNRYRGHGVVPAQGGQFLEPNGTLQQRILAADPQMDESQVPFHDRTLKPDQAIPKVPPAVNRRSGIRSGSWRPGKPGSASCGEPEFEHSICRGAGRIHAEEAPQRPPSGETPTTTILWKDVRARGHGGGRTSQPEVQRSRELGADAEADTELPIAGR